MANFKISAAQIASIRGGIEGNIAAHAAAVELAAARERGENPPLPAALETISVAAEDADRG